MTEFLEPKIKLLVEALNSWEGIKTYSSCEGHALHGSGPGPYVTFSCGDQKILGAISRKLIGTSWKIVLDDIAISKKAIHYTLRYVFEDLYEKLELEKMQEEIPRIAELIKKGATDKPQIIEDMFPVLSCHECNKNSFLIKSIYKYWVIMPSWVISSNFLLSKSCWVYKLSKLRESSSIVYIVANIFPQFIFFSGSTSAMTLLHKSTAVVASP